MSGYEHGKILNSTSIQPDALRPPLTNGQIASITIGTTFVFFLSMMMAVCAGEYWKYLHGTKKRPNLRRQRHPTTAKPSEKGEPVPSQLNSPNLPETSIIQSDFITSSSFKESDSSGDSSHRHRHSSAVEGTNSSIMYSESFIHGSSIGVDFDESLQRVNLDCVEGCDESTMKSEEEVSMVPLILVPCDDVLEMDGETLCDSVDSRDQYRLEADV